MSYGLDLHAIFNCSIRVNEWPASELSVTGAELKGGHIVVTAVDTNDYNYELIYYPDTDTWFDGQNKPVTVDVLPF